MHKLEKLILESYVDVLKEEERRTIKLKDLSPKIRQALEDRYGKSIDPEKDFLDNEMETYFFTNKIDKETGAVGHKVINLPSFKELYFGYSDIIDDIKVLMGNKEIQVDPKAKELFELIKTNFRKIQSYLRNNRPDQYAMMKATRSMEEAVSELKSNYPAPSLRIAGKEVDDIVKVGNNPEDWKVKFVDGTEEPYLNHLREITVNDPVMVKVRAAKMHADQMKKLDAYKKSPEGRAASRAQASAERKEEKAREIVRKLKIKRAQIEREMENDPDIESQGGPVADMYGDQLNRIDNAIEKAASAYNKPMDYDTAVGKIREEEEDSNPGKLTNIKTFGDLQRFVKTAKSGILGKKVGGALDAAIGFIPGIGNVKTGIDVIRALAKKQDGKTTNTFLDKMDIDDKASAIVDDKVEANFINYMHNRIADQDPNKTLPSNFNMNQYFNDFLSAEYEKRTIDGINEEAGPETVLEDATDQMLEKFPTLKAALIKLQTEDFKEFVDKIDWISPRPTEFRINLTNGQDYILKWTGKGFEAQIMGKRYFIDKIDDYQQALDKLAILYKEGPMGEPDEPVEPTDTDSGGGTGGDFPGDDAAGGDDTAADDAGDDTADTGGEEEGGEDLGDEPVDFEEPAEEPEA